MISSPTRKESVPLDAEFEPSKYQVDIFEWIKTGRGHAVVSAVAGSGKTSTLVEASKYLNADPNQCVFMAFSKEIATELEKKVGDRMTVKTTYATGLGCLYRALGEPVVESSKYSDLVRKTVDPTFDEVESAYQQALSDWRVAGCNGKAPTPPYRLNETRNTEKKKRLREHLRKLVRFCQLRLINYSDKEEVNNLVDYLGMEEELDGNMGFLFPLLNSGIDQGITMARTKKVVDFNDMVYLPHVWKLYPRKYRSFLFIDEAQDTSPAQLELIVKSLSVTTRAIAIGDPNQAVFGFAGADAYSMDRIVGRLKPTILPLSICYRCPKSHIRMAQQIVPEIEPAEWAEEGHLDTIEQEDIFEMLRAGDMVMSRMTAPLLRLFLACIRRRIRTSIRGSDLAAQISSTIKDSWSRNKKGLGEDDLTIRLIIVLLLVQHTSVPSQSE